MARDALAHSITPRTRAIIPVHLLGRIADMEPILSLAADRGLKVIEDACQAHGAVWRGKRAGSCGLAGAFSFYPAMDLGALGVGGMLVTHSAEMQDGARLLCRYR